MSNEPTIHRYPVSDEGAFVNAYLVETESGVVAVDSLLTVSESRALRAGLKRSTSPCWPSCSPIRILIITRGLTELVAGENVPIIAPQGVIDVIVRDDPLKDQILGPMFGDEWPAARTFRTLRSPTAKASPSTTPSSR